MTFLLLFFRFIFRRTQVNRTTHLHSGASTVTTCQNNSNATLCVAGRCMQFYGYGQNYCNYSNSIHFKRNGHHIKMNYGKPTADHHHSHH